MKQKKITSGTREWTGGISNNINCYKGCYHNCRYCYAKKMALRFKRIKTESDWETMVPISKHINKQYKKRQGRIMFPSSHDIGPHDNIVSNCLKVLEQLLRVGNEVLIVTKPWPHIIKKICNDFLHYKEQIIFRFTITSIDDEILKYWEPNAPTFADRLESLEYAFKHGFETSISIEPFLDKDPAILIKKVMPYIVDTVWIGKMNYQHNEYIKEISSIDNIKYIASLISIYPRLRLKDSIRLFLERHTHKS